MRLRRWGGGIPIFMYHHVSRHAGDRLTVSVERFEEQVRHIRRRGESLFLDDAVAYVRDEGSARRLRDAWTGWPVVLTFDDGYADFWKYAFPILHRHGVKATVFVNTSRLAEHSAPRKPDDDAFAVRRHAEIEAAPRSEDFLSWAEMREMERSGLVHIESHLHRHLHCDQSMDGETLRAELSCSQAAIESHLNKSCRYLAWPYGNYDQRGLQAAAEQGYGAAVTTYKGTNMRGRDPMQLRRITARDGPLVRFRFARWVFASPLRSEIYLRYKHEPQPASPS